MEKENAAKQVEFESLVELEKIQGSEADAESANGAIDRALEGEDSEADGYDAVVRNAGKGLPSLD